jgi:hypothetical protein
MHLQEVFAFFAVAIVLIDRMCLYVNAGSSEINDLAQFLDCVADVLWCTVCACMQTQHKQV